MKIKMETYKVLLETNFESTGIESSKIVAFRSHAGHVLSTEVSG